MLEVYLQLYRNDGLEEIPPLAMNLSLQLKFAKGFEVLKQAAAGGQGMAGFELLHGGGEEGYEDQYGEDDKEKYGEANQEEYEEAHDPQKHADQYYGEERQEEYEHEHDPEDADQYHDQEGHEEYDGQEYDETTYVGDLEDTGQTGLAAEETYDQDPAANATEEYEQDETTYVDDLQDTLHAGETAEEAYGEHPELHTNAEYDLEEYYLDQEDYKEVPEDHGQPEKHDEAAQLLDEPEENVDEQQPITDVVHNTAEYLPADTNGQTGAGEEPSFPEGEQKPAAPTVENSKAESTASSTTIQGDQVLDNTVGESDEDVIDWDDDTLTTELDSEPVPDDEGDFATFLEELEAEDAEAGKAVAAPLAPGKKDGEDLVYENAGPDADASAQQIPHPVDDFGADKFDDTFVTAPVAAGDDDFAHEDFSDDLRFDDEEEAAPSAAAAAATVAASPLGKRSFDVVDLFDDEGEEEKPEAKRARAG